eukprot:COSAG05_NODE_1081_length_5940_cov_4.264852_10_plen_186_part_00
MRAARLQYIYAIFSRALGRAGVCAAASEAENAAEVTDSSFSGPEEDGSAAEDGGSGGREKDSGEEPREAAGGQPEAVLRASASASAALAIACDASASSARSEAPPPPPPPHLLYYPLFQSMQYARGSFGGDSHSRFYLCACVVWRCVCVAGMSRRQSISFEEAGVVAYEVPPHPCMHHTRFQSEL